MTTERKLEIALSTIKKLSEKKEALEFENSQILSMICDNARHIINGHPVGYDFRKFVEKKFGGEL